MHVPEKFDFEHMHRSENTIPLVISHYITLRKGQDFLEVETVVENTAEDHRLRVLFPSGAQADTYLADSAFDVVERPIALRSDNHLYREMEVETKPQQSWTAVFDEQRGLAVISAGLLETAVRDLPERPLALTLFRGTKKTVGTVGEPGGQEKGRLDFQVLDSSHPGKPGPDKVMRIGPTNFNWFTVCPDAARRYRHLSERSKTACASEFFASRRPSSDLKFANDRWHLEVRLFNPLTTTIENRLYTENWPDELQVPQWVQPVDFESTPKVSRQPIDQIIQLKPKQIMTLRLF